VAESAGSPVLAAVPFRRSIPHFHVGDEAASISAARLLFYANYELRPDTGSVDSWRDLVGLLPERSVPHRLSIPFAHRDSFAACTVSCLFCPAVRSSENAGNDSQSGRLSLPSSYGRLRHFGNGARTSCSAVRASMGSDVPLMTHVGPQCGPKAGTAIRIAGLQRVQSGCAVPEVQRHQHGHHGGLGSWIAIQPRHSGSCAGGRVSLHVRHGPFFANAPSSALVRNRGGNARTPFIGVRGMWGRRSASP